MMDDLTYAYDGNRLMKVADAATLDRYGFRDDAINTAADTSNDYAYDANGNMKSDTNKGIGSMAYNHLNLPTSVNVTSNTGDGTGTIGYIYDAMGIKLKKTAPGIVTEYAGNFIYKKVGSNPASLEFFNQPEGYVEKSGGSYTYVYQYKDHLGNIRLSYSDADGNGTIEASSEIIEEKNYYPFGGTQKGYNNVVNGTAHNYGFNGKEENEELGLQWMDFGARNYDKWLGRWMNLDPLAEMSRRFSPYTYALDNPVFFIDPDGMFAEPFGDFYGTNGKYLGSDDIDDGKIYVSEGNKKNFLTANKKEVPGGLSSLGGIKTSLALTNAPSSHKTSPDTKSGLHEVRVDIDKDSNSSTFTEGGKVSVDTATNIASGEVNGFDVMNNNVNTSETDILGHSHPTETIVEGGKAFTFDANSPSLADKSSFKNRDVNFVSGNIESKAVTKNADGTFNTPNNKQGAVFYNRQSTPVMTISNKNKTMSFL